MNIKASKEIRQAEFFTPRLSDVEEKAYKWNNYHNQKNIVAKIYRDDDFINIADRMDLCGSNLHFAKVDGKAKLIEAKFCGCRFCPVCQYRKSQKWQARMMTALQLMADHQKRVRFLSLTLTIKNCAVTDLKETLKHMNESFARLARMSEWPGLGHVRSFEITRGEDGSAHPHIHSIIAVPANYFNTCNPNYLTHQKITEMWQKAAKLCYTPIVNVQAIRGNAETINKKSIQEVIKSFAYSIKPEKLTENLQWFLTMAAQVAGTRSVSTAGLFKEFLGYVDEISIEEVQPNDIKEETEKAIYSWFNAINQYRRNYNLEEKVYGKKISFRERPNHYASG